MSSDSDKNNAAIRVSNLGKCYHIYAKPSDRLKQFLARGRRKFYKEFWANRNLSFEIQRGKTIGIVGRNGSGKSTLLKMLAGTIAPTEGAFEIEGRITALLELGSGFNPEFTGRENVFLNGAILGIPRKEMEGRLESIERFADIGSWVNQPIKTYSKGMVCRLGFAVLANLDPEVFIVDEALAVGDAYFRHRCMLRFHDLKRRGVTILYVSHDAPSMKALCDEVIWLDNGRLKMKGAPNEVVSAYLEFLFHSEGGKVIQRAPSENGEADLAEEVAENAQDAPARDDHGRSSVAVVSTPESQGESGWPEHESYVPNVDRRTGDGACSIVGVGLHSADGRATRYVSAGETVFLRVTLRNDMLDTDTDRIQTGWILQNEKHLDVTGTNTGSEGVEVPIPNPGDRVTVTYRLKMPCLKPSSYSLSVLVSHFDELGKRVVADRIVNALIFEISASRRVHGLLAMETQVEINT